MKYLWLIRHAKSSWKNPDLDDHERPLNKRGERDSLSMSRFLASQDTELEVIYSSTAIRALSYAELLSEFTGVHLEPDLSFYTFDDETLLQILFQLPDHLSRVAIIGHNPAITELSNRLTESHIENVPTAALVHIEADVEEWSQLNSANCSLIAMYTPKQQVGSW